jgi:hypothetical protein
MRPDDRGAIVPKRLLHDFAQVDRCSVDRAAEQILAGAPVMISSSVAGRKPFGALTLVVERMVFMVDLRLARAELPGDGRVGEAPKALRVTA